MITMLMNFTKVILRTHCKNAIDKSQTFFKITNNAEKHYNFQYKDGTNAQTNKLIATQQYNYACDTKYVDRGLSFTNADHILRFLQLGTNLRKVILPADDPNLEINLNADQTSWCASTIVLDQKLDLNNVATFEWLKNLGCDLNGNNNAALLWACENGRATIVEYLIKGGADVCSEANNITPLKLAIEHGNMTIIELLVQAGAKFYGDEIGIAAANGHYEVVRYLCAIKSKVTNISPAPMRAPDQKYIPFLIMDSWTDRDEYFQRAINLALCEAAKYGHCDIVHLLHQVGAKLDCSSLHAATKGGHTMVAKYLIENGARINHDIFRAAIINGRIDILKILEYRNIGRLEYAALEYACEAGYLSIVQFLCERGYSYAGFRDGELLKAAIDNGRTDVAQYLIKKYEEDGKQVKYKLDKIVDIVPSIVPPVVTKCEPLRKLNVEGYYLTSEQKTKFVQDMHQFHMSCDNCTY